MRELAGPDNTLSPNVANLALGLGLLSLLAAVPAFYLALMSNGPRWVVGLYLFASAATAASAWLGRRQHAPPPTRRATRFFAGGRAGGALAAGLLLAAALPLGESLAFAGWRLVVAVGALARVGWALRPWLRRGGLPYLMALTVAVLGLCGLGFWWLEPRATSFGDGLWLAFTTAATVGYGDIVPTTPAAKIFAVFVVLLGFAVLSLVTAAIAAMWVKTEERRIEHEILRDLHRELRLVHQELAALRGEFKGPPT